MDIVRYSKEGYKRFMQKLSNKKKKLWFALTFILLNFLTWKKVQAHEKSFSSQNQNFGNQESSGKITPEIIGAQKKPLHGWTYKMYPFSKILKAQIKNPIYFNKKKLRWSNKKMLSKSSVFFPFLIEKVSENQKVKSEKNQINFMDLRIDGVYVLNLKKKMNQEKFSIEQKDFGVLQLSNKSSIYNPDSQSSHSVFFSFPETKKMAGFQDLIPFDQLRGFLLQSFSSFSGSFFSKNLLKNKLSSDFKTRKNNLRTFSLLERKKSIIFRKKKFRQKKKIYQKKFKIFFKLFVN